MALVAAIAVASTAAILITVVVTAGRAFQLRPSPPRLTEADHFEAWEAELDRY